MYLQRLPKSKKAEEIETCIKPVVIPEVNEGVKAEIVVVEETSYVKTEKDASITEGTVMTEEAMVLKAKEGNYVRDIEKNRVYCPSGKILRQKSEKKNGRKRYYNKLGCANCASKCTKSKYKEVDFPLGRTIISSRMSPKAETEAGLKEKKKETNITPLFDTTCSVVLCGYFLSPFGDRILVVVAEEGWSRMGSGMQFFTRFVGVPLNIN